VTVTKLLRKREIAPPPVIKLGLVGLLLVLALVNYFPTLFLHTLPAEGPLWAKLLKDLPVVAVLGIGLASFRIKDVLRSGLDRQVRVFLLVLAAWALLIAMNAAVTKPEPAGALVSLRFYVAYPLLALAIVGLDLSTRDILLLLRALVIMSAVEVLVAAGGAFGMWGGTTNAAEISVGGFSLHRALGTLGNPNNLAMFLGLPFFLLVARNRTLERSGLFSKTTTDVLASIMLVGLLLTFSRAAALLVAATLLLLLGKLRTSVTWIAAVVSVGAVVFMARAATPVELRYGDSVEVRAGWAEEALTGSTKNIGSALFGTGLGTATTLTAEGIEVVQTDNMLLAFILELGFSGALAYSALLASVLWLMWATLRMRSPIAPVAGGLMAFGVMFALYTPVTVNARAFPPAMLFWLASGLMVQLAINDRTSRRAEPRPTD
jgi:hypothetical protein